MNLITLTKKKSEVNATSPFDFVQITRKHDSLLDCEIIDNITEYNFNFYYNDLEPFSIIQGFYKYDQIRALINVSTLFELNKRLDFSFADTNIMIDRNLIPKIIYRDTYKTYQYSEENMLNQYIALIATTLNNTYSYEEYYYGGIDLLLINKDTAKLAELHSIDEVISYLYELYFASLNYYQKKCQVIERSKLSRRNIIFWISVIIGICSLLIASFLVFYKNPLIETENRLYQCIIEEDTPCVQANIAKVGVDNIKPEIKTAIAKQKITSLDVSQQTKDQFTKQLDNNTTYLDYWVYLTINDYTQSYKLAQLLEDKTLKVISLQQEKQYLINQEDTQHSERIDEINNQLERLEKE